MAEGKVALVTGSNAGLGLTLCERLLSEHKGLRLCLACRNKARAESALRALQLSHPHSDIYIVIVDTSNVQSVCNAALEIKKRYCRIDFLYLNAGIMSVQGVDWSAFFSGLFSSQCVHMFTTGHGLLKQSDSTTDDNLRNVFATNIFGHFIMIRQLEDIMGNYDHSANSTIITWTSSSAALRENFDINDIQHEMCIDPYSSSKFATDILNTAINERLNSRAIYSFSVCPGLVMTNLTSGILPQWLWTILWPLMLLIRLFVPSTNLDTFNGCEAHVWLSHQDPETLDSHNKYCSETSILGQRSVRQKKMQITTSEANNLFKQLETLEKRIMKDIN